MFRMGGGSVMLLGGCFVGCFGFIFTGRFNFLVRFVTCMKYS